MDATLAAIRLCRAVTDRGSHCRSSPARMAEVMPRMAEAVAPIRARALPAMPGRQLAGAFAPRTLPWRAGGSRIAPVSRGATKAWRSRLGCRARPPGTPEPSGWQGRRARRLRYGPRPRRSRARGRGFLVRTSEGSGNASGSPGKSPAGRSAGSPHLVGSRRGSIPLGAFAIATHTPLHGT